MPVVAETGESGLEMARRLDPDVVLLDLMLPDIQRVRRRRRLRSDRATMLTPVVMLTALGGSENRLRAFRVGRTPILPSPTAYRNSSTPSRSHARGGAEIEQERCKEIHVELNSEITLLQDLNDFLMSLCKSTSCRAPTRSCNSAPGGDGNRAERHRVGQPPPVGATG